MTEYTALEPWTFAQVTQYSLTLTKFRSEQGNMLFNAVIDYELMSDDDTKHQVSFVTDIYEVDPREAVMRAVYAARVYTSDCLDIIQVIDSDGNPLPDLNFTINDVMSGNGTNGFVPLPVAQPALPLYFFLQINKFQDEESKLFRYNPVISLVCESIEGTARHAVTIVTEVWEDDAYEAAKQALQAALKLAGAYKEQIMIVEMTKEDQQQSKGTIAGFTITDIMNESQFAPQVEEMPKYLH